MDDEKTGSDQHQSEPDLPPLNGIVVPDSTKEDEISSSKRDDGAHKTEENWPNRMMAICTGVLVLITGFYTYYASGQLSVMQGQLAEMKSGAAQTDSAIKASNRIAKAGEDANARALEADRPWIGMTNFSVTGFGPGNPATVRIYFTNAGKRPAYITLAELDTHRYAVFPDK